MQYAVATLEKGRKLLNDNTLFVNELTNAYIQLNRNDLVVEEALNSQQQQLRLLCHLDGR